MSNNQAEYVDIEITSEYGYGFEETCNALTTKILHMQTMFETTDFMESQLELIGQEFVSTAQRFAQAQGLGGGTSLLAWGSTPKNRYGTIVGPKNLNGFVSSRGPTGNLINHIKYQLVGNGSTKNIMFYNDATNARGQYYAGHIEYGFHDRGGGLVPARPFMRPALYAVADSSRGRIQRTMKAYLEQIWAMESLKFGYPVTPKGNYRKFYQLHDMQKAKGYGTYTSKGLPKGRIKESTSIKQRMAATVDRRGAKNTDYTQKISGRMGSKGGWKNGPQTVYRDGKWVTHSPSEHFKSDTRWLKTPTSTQKSDKSLNPYTGKTEKVGKKEGDSYKPKGTKFINRGSGYRSGPAYKIDW